MARASIQLRCTECGYKSVKALGRCPNCGAWDSFAEEAPPLKSVGTGKAGIARPRPSPNPAALTRLEDVSEEGEARFSSRIGELDRVLGGGFVPGEVLLLGGEPGVGKSTLLLQVAQQMLEAGQRVVYLAGEESPGQIRLRARRLGVSGGLELLRETELEAMLATLEAAPPDFLVVDSIQTIETTASPGSLVAVRDATAALTRFAKRHQVTTVLVGHVTKEGVVAGPKVIEHVVDATLYLESAGNFRILRSSKNRFGPVGELGVFSMVNEGLAEVPNPSAAFLAERPLGAPGSVVALSLSGERALALEVQALAARTPFPAPRRVSQGLDSRRVDVVLAVLERRLNLPLGNLDIYVNLAGGLRIFDPGLDLAVGLAVYSAVVGRPIPQDVAVVGEVGLAGELRSVEGLERRLREGQRAGFERLVHPPQFKSLEAAVNMFI
ncbi:DNA repair protein RadA [Meiothermus ruber]|uniref:DNA repair protein RadA n=1 Tax=Meiothermus ruber (strain ATCC 35948 / DSM 1279 / VKM B-1258 / 21) TaxID=504728 RepID=A0A806CSI2_MEIRD|nr:DNA repair protein RadA [Meiothermus ruber]ADD28417.1 DNA repair protein RadA [Meiothermus ruber DSM 1279]MCL6528978.1 DNA repair protein RadA [Meiothermus ruber]